MALPYDVSALFNVKDLVAVVTGGGTGLGLTIANALDQNGAKAVYIVGRREEKLQEAATAAVKKSIIPIVGDISDQESLKAVAERLKQDQGYVNAVVANAGIGGHFNIAQFASFLPNPRKALQTAQEFVDDFWDAGMADFTNTMHVNTTGYFFTVLAFLELLVAGNAKGNVFQKSQVLVISSAGAWCRAHPAPAYVSSKVAVLAMVKQLSTMLAPYEVRTNALCPGFFLSDMSIGTYDALGDKSKKPDEEGAFDKTWIPAGRMGTAEELAGNVLYFLSKAGGYTNGECLLCDGGVLGQVPATY